MDKLLYISASGAREIMRAQAANTHNLANATTVGFQADLAAMQALQVYGPGYSSRAYAQADRGGVDFTKGAIQSTGREMDVAVNGQGWIAVLGANGQEGYTRAGDLRISPDGMLENGRGQAIMGDGGPIQLPESRRVQIGNDGTVSVLPAGQQGNNMVVVGRIRLVNPDKADLVKSEDGLLRLRDGSEAPDSTEVNLISGSLESSNVNSVEAMVTMIELARQFDMQVKMMKTAKENDAASTKILGLS